MSQDLNNANRMPDFIRVGEADPSSASIKDIVASLPPRPVATFLINAFFKHATSFYYFVDRVWLDETVDHIYTNMTGLSSKDVTASCLILMILAVGTQYAHLESTKNNNRRNAGRSSHSETSSNWELEVGAAFYRQVAKLISEVIHSGSVLSVQVFLLLGLYYLPLDASGLGYIYLNLAIKIAIQNGMHRNVSRSAFHADTKELRRRIWWTAYCMERSVIIFPKLSKMFCLPVWGARKIGVYHGRPTAILRSDIDATLPQSAHDNITSGDSFDPGGLYESIDLLSQAETFLHEM